ncbi:hypothetical protein [Acaryochloris sp. 'Moss Beach']|nr:hypothetical protein [Acaryochloris sp. 'Moss Beach']
MYDCYEAAPPKFTYPLPQKSAQSPHLFIRRIRLTLFSMLGIFLATGLGG